MTTKNDLTRRDMSGSPVADPPQPPTGNGSAHTPGPWRVRTGSEGVVGRNRVGAFEVIAHTAQRSNIAANARLIAAAPELLVALKAIMETLQREAPGTPLNNHRFDMLGIQANNAIAKAEGR